MNVNDEDAFYYWEQSSLYEKEGKYELALTYINKAMELDPYLSDGMLFNRLSIYEKMGKLEQAIEDCTKLIDVLKICIKKDKDVKSRKEGKKHLKDLIKQLKELKKGGASLQ